MKVAKSYISAVFANLKTCKIVYQTSKIVPFFRLNRPTTCRKPDFLPIVCLFISDHLSALLQANFFCHTFANEKVNNEL